MKIMNYLVAARACGPKEVLAGYRGPGGRRTYTRLSLPLSLSTHEAVAIGLAEALDAARQAGAISVRVVVHDPVLQGYLRRGWRPRSPAMIGALSKLVEATKGMHIELVFPRAG